MLRTKAGTVPTIQHHKATVPGFTSLIVSATVEFLRTNFDTW